MPERQDPLRLEFPVVLPERGMDDDKKSTRQTAVIAVNDDVGDGFPIALRDMTIDRYMRNPVVLWTHDRWMELPIGKTSMIRWDDDGRLVADFEFLDGDPLADRIRNAWEQGVLRAASISVRMVDDPDEPGRERPELLEWSIVAVPADRDAVRDLDAERAVRDDCTRIISRMLQRGADHLDDQASVPMWLLKALHDRHAGDAERQIDTERMIQGFARLERLLDDRSETHSEREGSMADKQDQDREAAGTGAPDGGDAVTDAQRQVIRDEVGTAVRAAVDDLGRDLKDAIAAAAKPDPAPVAPPADRDDGEPADEVDTEEAIQVAAEERAELLGAVRELVPDRVDTRGLSNRDLLVLAVGDEVPDAAERSTDYLVGALDQIRLRRARADTKREQIRRRTPAAGRTPASSAPRMIPTHELRKIAKRSETR